jgi:hypothetical protein
MKLRNFLTDCDEIANCASEYGRRICQVLRLVPGVPPDFIRILGRLPRNKGDGEKGDSFQDSDLKTILLKQKEVQDETTRILIGIGLSGGPQVIDSCFLPLEGINWRTGLISFKRVKSREEARFVAIPWLLDLLRQRRERLGLKAAYAMPELIFTREQQSKADCNTTVWEEAVPAEYVNRASVQGSKKIRKFLRETCGFTSLKLTNKSFRIHRISFWASVGFKLKTRMRMAGHKDVQRHTDYDRGADFEIQRAAEISWKYYDAIEKGLPFFIPTTPYDLYEVILGHWQQLPEVVRHAMRQELGGTTDSLAKLVIDGFAAQRAYLDSKFERVEQQLAVLVTRVEAIAMSVESRLAA